MSKCKMCEDTGKYYCPVLLMDRDCYKCEALEKKLSKKIIEDAVMHALAFGAPDVSGDKVVEDGVVYFKDKNGITSLIMEEEANDAFVNQCKKEHNKTKESRK